MDPILTQNKTNGRASKSPRVIIYDPLNHTLGLERLTEDESKFLCSSHLPKFANFLEKTSVAVQLSRWRNDVNVFLDQESRSGFVAIVKLNRLGPKITWQRRLQNKYTTLYMKGLKPDDEAEASTSRRLRELESLVRRSFEFGESFESL